MPFANWRQYRTQMLLTISGLILTAVGYLSYPTAQELWGIPQDVRDFSVYIETHEQEVAIIVANLNKEAEKQDKNIEQLLKYHERDYLLIGTGSVGNFGGDEAYVRINRRSDARIYKEGDRIKITCDVEGKPDAILEVRGTFSNSNQDLLISFSSEAAEDLGINGRVEVELEPVNGEDE